MNLSITKSLWSDRLIFLHLLAIIVPLEWAAASLAYHTLSEITSGVLMILVGVNVPLLIAAFWQPRLATVGVLLLALLILPYQAYLGHRLLMVQTEAAGIVAHAYETKEKTGRFPADLDGYQFANATTKRLIQRYVTRDDGQWFQVTYRIGTRDTSHWYEPKNGWGYYPD